MDWLPISADSHITEPPNCYRDHIDPAYRERAPRIVTLEKMGDTFIVDGMKTPVPLGLIAAAGIAPKDIRIGGAKFEDLHKGGWDPKVRLADQDRDGVGAEMIYPTVGMLICNHPDFDYKKACFDAYNRWLQQYCSHDPKRLIGLGQTAIRTVEEGIADLEAIKAMGFKGVMMPGNPGEKDYDDPAFDPFWEAAIELELPLSFHILTTSGDNTLAKPRGPKLNGFLSIIRGCQDIMGMLVFCGVFERFPEAQGRLRRGRRRLGAALHVPHGPCLQAPPLLDEGQGPGAAAVGVFPREHLAHLPGRLYRLPVRRSDGRQAADVGERLPAQRLDLAVEPGRDQGADRSSGRRPEEAHPSRQCRGALQARGLALETH